MDGETVCGCLGAVVLLLVGGCCVGACVYGCSDERIEARKEELRLKSEEAAREAEERERSEQERKAAEAEATREEKLRTFSLKEAPLLWKAYQNLQAEIASQNAKIEDLRNTLVEFNQDPDKDADFQSICALRDEMVGALKTMRTKMEDAYLASRKYAATPSRKEFDDLRRKHLEDGLREAEAAERRYRTMTQDK